MLQILYIRTDGASTAMSWPYNGGHCRLYLSVPAKTAQIRSLPDATRCRVSHVALAHSRTRPYECPCRVYSRLKRAGPVVGLTVHRTHQTPLTVRTLQCSRKHLAHWPVWTPCRFSTQSSALRTHLSPQPTPDQCLCVPEYSWSRCFTCGLLLLPFACSNNSKLITHSSHPTWHVECRAVSSWLMIVIDSSASMEDTWHAVLPCCRASASPIDSFISLKRSRKQAFCWKMKRASHRADSAPHQQPGGNTAPTGHPGHTGQVRTMVSSCRSLRFCDSNSKVDPLIAIGLSPDRNSPRVFSEGQSWYSARAGCAIHNTNRCH